MVKVRLRHLNIGPNELLAASALSSTPNFIHAGSRTKSEGAAPCL